MKMALMEEELIKAEPSMILNDESTVKPGYL
jgi:hypothetical protein